MLYKTVVKNLSLNLLWMFFECCSSGGKSKSGAVRSCSLNECCLQIHLLNSCHNVFTLLWKELCHAPCIHRGDSYSQGLFRKVGVGGQVLLPLQRVSCGWSSAVWGGDGSQQCSVQGWPLLWPEAAVQRLSGQMRNLLRPLLLLLKTWAVFSIWSCLALAFSHGFLLSLSLLD